MADGRAARLAHGLDRRLLAAPLTRALYGRFLREPAARAAIALGLRGWRARIADAVAAPDNRHIPRVADAGKVVGGHLVMHNGLKVHPRSYYGLPLQVMLERNRGVHEPQEERAFAEVLRHVPPGAVMIELGSYWAFYSMWFRSATGGSCYLVEPDPDGLESGRANFALNGMDGTFIRAFVGAASAAGDPPTLCVDDLVAERGIARVHVLHADVQGAEMDMLRGAGRTFAEGRVDHVFISTHGNDLHARCRSFLEGRGFAIVAAADLDETYSFDGLIVARAPHLSEPGAIPIALKGRPG